MLTPWQKKKIQQYENICGFEFMHKEDIKEENMSFEEAWNLNLRWLEGLHTEVNQINIFEECEIKEQ